MFTKFKNDENINMTTYKVHSYKIMYVKPGVNTFLIRQIINLSVLFSVHR